jgi:mannose-6-phosphate isomerase-like protein (cupin superfamily)
MTVAYVYFVEDTQEIASISNIKTEQENLKVIEVPHEEVRPILSGRERLRDYKVSFDLKLGEFVFVPKLDVHEAQSLSWDDAIFQVPSSNYLKDADVVFMEDSKNKTWTIEVSESVKTAFRNIPESQQQQFEFYVTRKDDANVLLSTFRVDNQQLSKFGKIEIKTVDINEPTSVYCRKIFDSYLHVTL